MTFRVVIEEQAASDISAYAHWIADHGSPQGAVGWVDGIESAIASLSTMPNRCRLAGEAEFFDLPIRQLLFQSHRILFLVDAKTVRVLHVRHAARLPMKPVKRKR